MMPRRVGSDNILSFCDRSRSSWCDWEAGTSRVIMGKLQKKRFSQRTIKLIYDNLTDIRASVKSGRAILAMSTSRRTRMVTCVRNQRLALKTNALVLSQGRLEPVHLNSRSLNRRSAKLLRSWRAGYQGSQAWSDTRSPQTLSSSPPSPNGLLPSGK